MKKYILVIFLSTGFFVRSHGQCDLIPEAPVVEGRTIIGTGSRDGGCTTRGKITVVLREDRRFWFDRTLASKTASGTNIRISAIYKCKGTGSQRVFTEVRSRGKKAQSKRVYAPLCG